MRTAIDRFKDAADLGQISQLELEVGNENYPPDLQTLVDGVPAANDATGRKLKFLRRVPVDPMTHDTEWGLRAYQDEPDSSRWGGQTCSTSTRPSRARRSTAVDIETGRP